ncbi:hypothetical protein BM1_03358 [Bipolaris maydis]|nr:hypothetical protein BM1_03358 [Bipolaris maydis]KAJ6276919.1 hypothetical protein J3E71DRAFT_403419 [Bipolaris maydis]
MGWFSKPKSSFKVPSVPPAGAPDSTPTASTIAHGVDPPFLSEYGPGASPASNYYSTVYQSDTTTPQYLTTIHEAIPSAASLEVRSNEIHQNSSTSHHAPKRIVDIEDLRNYAPRSIGHIPIPLQPASPVDSVTSTDVNEHAYPRQSTTPIADQFSVLPPTQTVSSPTTGTLTKPTCSLNLMCYRSGSQGCVRRQIHVLSQARLGISRDDYSKIASVKNSGGLIRSDKEFFAALHREYEHHICGFWRRYLSLKTLRQIRLLSYTPSTRPEVVPMDDFTLQEMFYAYQHSESIKTESEWIDWVFRLRQADRRHALEFVEGWSGFRIGLVGSVPWVAATVVGVAWTARGGDAQTAFTVAGFILTVGTSLLALLAIVSKIES